MKSTTEPKASALDLKKQNTLGTVQLRNRETNDIILVPQPSDDPNDPLNWSNARKHYIFALACFGIFFAHAVVVGPAVALEVITAEFYGDSQEAIMNNISTTAYLQTACSLMIGLGNLIWVPLAIKYGRRPVYIASYLLLTACCVWSGAAKTFPSALAGRILLGFACGAPEIIAPLTITDLYFLHQRGRVMVVYTCALSAGVGVGVVFAGLITRDYGWRMIFWIFTPFIVVCTILVILTFPETHYQRRPPPPDIDVVPTASAEPDKVSDRRVEDASTVENQHSRSESWSRTTFRGGLRVFSGTYTRENLASLAFRPLVAILLPAVLWASLINSVTIGMIVVISANFASAFSTIYGFQTWQSGLTYISTVIGSLIAIFLGGHFADWVADKLTKLNKGVRTPEMRLPAMVVSLVAAPLACILYGVGMAERLHWICPTIGIGLVNFAVVQSNNVALVYILDSYRPIAGEVVVTQSVFKAIFGFLMSFYVNSWVQQSGFLEVFGILAGLTAGVILLTVPLYFFGDRIRRATWQWGFARQFLHWHSDREVGE